MWFASILPFFLLSNLIFNPSTPTLTVIDYTSLPPTPTSRHLQNWRLKKLGSGTDFFISPKSSMSQFNAAVVSSVPNVTGCAVLSNCARFELFISHPSDVPPSHLTPQITKTLLALSSYPETSDEPNISPNITTGIREVVRRLCLISSGLLNPKRPFSPYNSRDSHIMLQMKRCGEAVRAQGSGFGVSLAVDTALRCGKVVRDEGRTPEIKALKGYSGGRWGGVAPEGIREEVERGVMVAVEGVVDDGVERILGGWRSEDIEGFRGRWKGRVGKGVLHEWTLRLREGEVSIEEAEEGIGRGVMEERVT